MEGGRERASERASERKRGGKGQYLPVVQDEERPLSRTKNLCVCLFQFFPERTGPSQKICECKRMLLYLAVRVYPKQNCKSSKGSKSRDRGRLTSTGVKMHKIWARARPCAGQDQSLAAAGAAVGKFVGERNHVDFSSKLFLATAEPW